MLLFNVCAIEQISNNQSHVYILKMVDIFSPGHNLILELCKESLKVLTSRTPTSSFSTVSAAAGVYIAMDITVFKLITTDITIQFLSYLAGIVELELCQLSVFHCRQNSLFCPAKIHNAIKINIYLSIFV